MNVIIHYLFSTLLGENNKDKISHISYGPCKEASVIIQPADFFDDGVYLTERSLPTLPLAELEGVPVLFGDAKVWEEDGQICIGADLIASAYFLLTRYEECVRKDVRDQHGRFPGKESLPYRAGFLHRPIVEEYGKLLRKYLRQAGVDVKEPAAGFRHIYLTHDVDMIWTWDNLYRALLSTAKRLIKNQPKKLQPLLSCMDYKKFDPVYTFPWLVEQDDSVRQVYGENICTPIYFFMGCTNRQHTDKGYLANPRRPKKLISYLQNAKCTVGYHTSYSASLDMTLAQSEVNQVANLAGHKITHERHHYLASREPEDFYPLIQAGITDDFTMGYADVAGFRLGTCRPVQWIDPIKKEITPLTLHPMTVMECTLDGDAYMGIQEEGTAYNLVRELLDSIYTHGGQVVLLWHNDSVHPSCHSYHRTLYMRTLAYLRSFVS